jgi:hypothetical protein
MGAAPVKAIRRTQNTRKIINHEETKNTKNN